MLNTRLKNWIFEYFYLHLQIDILNLIRMLYVINF